MTRKLANLSQRLASRFVETRSIIVPTNETGTTCTSTKHIHNSSNVATLAKRRFAPTNRANRPLSSPTIDAPPPIIFFNRRGSCHFQLVDRIYEIYDYSCFFSLVSTNRGRSIHAHQLFRDARLTAAFNLLCGQPISCRWERMDDALPRSQRLTIRRRELF